MNLYRRIQWTDRLGFHSVRCMCRFAIRTIQEKTNKQTHISSIGDHLTWTSYAKMGKKKKVKKIGYCNKCVMHGQSTVNTHTNTYHCPIIVFTIIFATFSSILSHSFRLHIPRAQCMYVSLSQSLL